VKIELVLPKFKLLSGAERLILDLGRALQARGQEVSIVCHAFHPSCRPVAAALEVRETGLRMDWTGNHYLDSISGYVLAPLLRRWISPDADVVCVFGPALTLAAFRRRGSRQRLLYCCYEPPRVVDIDRDDVLERVRGWRWAVGPLLRLYRHVDRWLVGRVDAVLVTGPFGRERVAAVYDRESAVVTPGVRLGISSEGRAEARRRLGFDSTAAMVLNVNFLHPRKRVDLLLRAWAEVEKRVGNARLVIVGDGPEAAALRRASRALGLSRVRFCGFVPESELPSYYQAADLLCHVARDETFGLTILEAAAFGLPAVAVDEGGPRHTVIDGETGVLVAAVESEIAAAIRALLEDPGRCGRMGERARERVHAEYRGERGAEEFLALCEALSAGSAGDRRPHDPQATGQDAVGEKQKQAE